MGGAEKRIFTWLFLLPMFDSTLFPFLSLLRSERLSVQYFFFFVFYLHLPPQTAIRHQGQLLCLARGRLAGFCLYKMQARGKRNETERSGTNRSNDAVGSVVGFALLFGLLVYDRCDYAECGIWIVGMGEGGDERSRSDELQNRALMSMMMMMMDDG